MNAFDRFYRRLPRPLLGRSRLVMALLVVPLVLSFFFPLWRIGMVAPQYPEGLALEIYSHTVEGDIQEVNTLNHYIGMAPIDRESLSDLDWIPFALGVLILLTLRVAAIGNFGHLIDLFVLFVYFSAFSMARFAYKMYVFGHNLDPRAPFKMEPFTPPILGSKQVANFVATSMPGAASALIFVFGIGLIGVLVWNFWRPAPSFEGVPQGTPSGAAASQ
jgi:hypothetical protein